MNDTNSYLIERANKFMNELGVASTKFCERVQISRTTLHQWRHGRLKLGDKTIERIDNYLRHYGF